VPVNKKTTRSRRRDRRAIESSGVNRGLVSRLNRMQVRGQSQFRGRRRSGTVLEECRPRGGVAKCGSGREPAGVDGSRCSQPCSQAGGIVPKADKGNTPVGPPAEREHPCARQKTPASPSLTLSYHPFISCSSGCNSPLLVCYSSQHVSLYSPERTFREPVSVPSREVPIGLRQ
jgi:hypothetical protein